MKDFKEKIKIYSIKSLLFLFKGVILFAKFIKLIFAFLKKAFLFLFKIFLKLGGKNVILSGYKTYLGIKKAVSNLFLPAKNIFLYPFVNKETIHIVIVIITILVSFENIKIRVSHAQNNEDLLGNNNILSTMFAKEELGDAMLIEEGAAAETEGADNSKQPEYSDTKEFAVKSNQQIGTTTSELESELQETKILAASDALLKPEITSTTNIEEPSDFSTFERQEIINYTVQAGDVLGSIATKFGLDINSILWANNLSYYSIIRPGDTLKILPISGVLHTVQSGENLSFIAKTYNADMDKILAFNNLKDVNSLKKGQELIIPGGIKKIAPKAAAVAKASPYNLKTILPTSKDIYNSSSRFIWPAAASRITQYYHLGHHAIDIGGKIGTPIYAIEKGQVTLSGWSTGYGNNIIVDHGGGQKSRYAHFSKLYVKKGAFVEKDQQIGEMGSTGWSTGPHLHIEININGINVNPLQYLK